MASRKQIAAARRNIKKAQTALRRKEHPRRAAARRAAGRSTATAFLRREYHAKKAAYHRAGEALGRAEGIHHGKKRRKRSKTRHKRSR
jgi:hypothetical protein